MDSQQDSSLQIPSKKHNALLILAIIFVATEILVFSYMSLGFADEKVSGSWAGIGSLVVSFAFLTPIAIVGAIIGGICFKKARSIAGLILLVLSILLVAPPISLTLAEFASPGFTGMARYFEHNAAVREKTRYEDAKTRHYQILQQRFIQPQNVKEVRSKYILLDDNLVVEPSGSLNWDLEQENKFENFVQQNLVGKTVTLSLPDFNTFTQEYIPNAPGAPLFDVPLSQSPQASAQGIRSDYFGEVPVLIYVNGKLLQD
jgi:hypothetical protein